MHQEQRAPIAWIDPQALLDALDEAALVIDGEGAVRATNAAYSQVQKSAAASLLPIEGSRLALSEAPDGPLGARGEALAAIQRVLRGELARLKVELPGATPVAGQWELTVTACAVEGAPGALLRLRDIGERLCDEQSRHLADGIEAMQIGFHLYHMEDLDDDRTLRIVYANNSSQAVSRRPREALVGKTLDEVFPGARGDGVIANYAEMIRTGKPFSFERLFDGESPEDKRGMLIRAFPLPGQRMGVLFENVTSRVVLAQSLERTTQFLDSIIDNIPSVIFMKEAKELRYSRVNREFERLFGVSREQLLGKSDADIFPPEDAAHTTRTDREVFACGQVLDIPEETVFIEGRGKLTFHTRKVPLFDDLGRPLYLLGFSDDITERLLAEASKRNEIVLLETQRRLMEVIRELSTPVLPVYEGILVVPLVGQLDSARSALFLEALLSSIQRHSAEVVLIDITGVSVVDASVAGHLAQATRAAALLGTGCHLVGVSPSVARTMVDLGIDFGALTTHRDLQAGLLHGLARQGKAIVARAR